MSEMKRPTEEQMAKFKKNANDASLSAEVRAKFQAIVDKFENVTEEVGEDVVKAVEPKKRGRKPRATSTTKTTKTKQSASDVEKAKAEIKKRTGKTEEECESIIEEYRALRTKAQEGKRKAEQASATNKKRVEKLDQKGDLIEGTNVKTADAVIETTAKDVAEKIEQQIEAVEEKAEKEAKAEVAKDKTIKTTTDKKEAVEAKVEKKVKDKTKTIVKRVVIDTSSLLTSIADSLGKFDKDSQKEFLIKLRSDIDKLLSKYAFGGMTDGATQVMNIQQSNLSASSVNPTMFANGGGVDSSLNCEKTYKDYRYSKGYSRGWEYDSKTKTTKKYIIDLIVDDESRHLYHETNDSREILGYVNALKKNAKNLYRNFDGIEVRDAVDGDYRRILVVDYNKGKWSDTKIYRDMNSLLLQDVLLNYGFKPERGDVDAEGVDFYDEIESFRFTNEPFYAVVDKEGVNVYNSDDEEEFDTNDATELDIYLNGFKRHYPNIKKYAKGGMTEHGLRVGDEIEADGKTYGINDIITVLDSKKRRHTINLDKGERSRAMAYKKGGNVSSMLRNRRGM